MRSPVLALGPALLFTAWGLAALAAGARWLALGLLVVGLVAQAIGTLAARGARGRHEPRRSDDAGLDGTFRHDYAIEVVEGQVAGDPVILLPTGRREDAGDGTILRVTPRGGTAWLGLFGGFRPGRGRLFSTPHERRLLVVSGDRAYLVPVDSPAGTEVVPAAVHGVFLAPARGLLVIQDLTGFEAYGREGRVWRSARVSWDGLTVTRVSEDVIEGTATDLQDREIPFRLDLATGRHEGGSWPRDGRAPLDRQAKSA